MGKDMSAVGSSASASKTDAGLRGKEILVGVRFELSQNGGYILHQSYRYERPADSKSLDCYPGYCPDKTFTFKTYEEMEAHVHSALKAMKPS